MILLLFAVAPPIGPLPPGAIARLGDLRLNHGQEVRGAAFSLDGKRLLAVDGVGDLLSWDIRTGRLLQRTPAADAGSGRLDPHPGRDAVLWLSWEKARLWDHAAGKALLGVRDIGLPCRLGATAGAGSP